MAFQQHFNSDSFLIRIPIKKYVLVMRVLKSTIYNQGRDMGEKGSGGTMGGGKLCAEPLCKELACCSIISGIFSPAIMHIFKAKSTISLE